jgi:HAD superfamily hydrolase (TIGR01484 family)
MHARNILLNKMDKPPFLCQPGNTQNYRGIVFTDLDGTLLDTHRRVKDTDYQTLEMLKKEGYLRVLATGRNLYSLFKVIDTSFPVDYVIFSSGAGIFNMQTKEHLRSVAMEPGEVKKVAYFFFHLSMDFAVHHPVPDNHYFSYYVKTKDNGNFIQRIKKYKEYASEWKFLPDHFPRASQLLSIITWRPGETDPPFKEIHEKIREELPDYTVIRATSPLDHRSLWIEVFPRVVSKGKSASWLASCYHMDKENTMAVGNDYNDLDLLSWARQGYVVDNSPGELKALFSPVASHNHCGFAEAVTKWLS